MKYHARLAASGTAQPTAAQLRCIATDRYHPLSAPIPPGTLLNHTSGRAHQISRANATAASAPANCRPSESRSRISRNNSSRVIPSSAPTRGSRNGATASPRRSKIGASHRAIRVQNAHSASKNNHPRACRPLPSVNSDVSEIILVGQTFLSVSLLSLRISTYSASLRYLFLCSFFVLYIFTPLLRYFSSRLFPQQGEDLAPQLPHTFQRRSRHP